MIRIGVLLPRSTLFPAVGLDLLNGIKACVQYHQINEEFKLITENIGFGTNDAEIYTKAEKLLLQEDTDIVIAVADSHIGEMLEPLFTACNKILMMVNFGAGFPDKWVSAPTTIVHSLNFCLCTRLTGSLAASHPNKKAINVVSYYDAGYRQCYSLLNSHQKQGGIPCYTHVTNFKKEEFSIQPVEEFLDQNPEITNLLCSFAGDLAELFYHHIASVQQKHELNLFVTPMLLDESVTDDVNKSPTFANVKGYTPWVSSLTNRNNQEFTTYYSTTLRKKVNLFAVLGWDTGLLLQAIFQKMSSGFTTASEIVSALGDTTFQSPRGWMKLDVSTNHTYGPAWLMSSDHSGKLNVEGAYLEVEKEWKEFTTKEFPVGESSGWRNTYLCI